MIGLVAYLIGDRDGCVAVAKGAQLGALSLADFGRQHDALRLARMGVEPARRLWAEFAADEPRRRAARRRVRRRRPRR
jgi:hypothetical protein